MRSTRWIRGGVEVIGCHHASHIEASWLATRFINRDRSPTWNWPSADWRVFQHNIAALLPALAAARRAQGELLGLAKVVDLEEARGVQASI
jgi:hypothetical protein